MFSAYIRNKGLEGLYKFPWKTGIVAFMANPATLKGEEVRETFDAIARDPFFDIIESNLLPEEAWREAEEVIRSSGIEVTAGLQPLVLMDGYNPSSLSEQERKKAVTALIKGIEASVKRGIYTVAFPSGPDPGPGDREAAKDALIKSLKEIVEYANEAGAYVVLETFDRDYDKRQLIGPIGEAVEIARSVREDYANFGLLWDLSHAPMLNEKPGDIREAAEYLANIHIGCAKKTPEGLKDWHPGFYRPNAINSIEDVKELLRVLVDIGYRRNVSFEVKPEEGQFWLEVVHSAKGVLYTAYAQLLAEML